jgi:hypothetical protein
MSKMPSKYAPIVRIVDLRSSRLAAQMAREKFLIVAIAPGSLHSSG